MCKRYVCAVLACLALLGGCRHLRPADDDASALRVGITTDYPPLVFKQRNQPAGAEIDLARALGQALQRPVRLVELAWGEQIDALLDGRIDIIMSGMSITETRQVRIAFSEPWLKMGLMALVRRRDAPRYRDAGRLLDGAADIGVQPDSTAAVFVNRHYKGAAGVTYLEPTAAPYYLVTRRIDVFIHDGPAVVWMASENEADLEALPHVLHEEAIAWGLRKDDDDLRLAVNAVLERWRADGTLERITARWLPRQSP